LPCASTCCSPTLLMLLPLLLDARSQEEEEG
jgi:hypothetical protein